MNGILGIILIIAFLWGYCSFMDYAFTQAVGEAIGHVETSGLRTPADTIQTTLADFGVVHLCAVIKHCDGCNKRTGFSDGECNVCAYPQEASA